MTKSPANPFEWRRYIEEEDARRGAVVKTTRKRREALAPITSTEDNRLKPRGFTVYNKVSK